MMSDGAPEFVRMDNYTEMIRNIFADGCRFSAAKVSFIDPGLQWQKAYLEPFERKLRHECLDVEVFTILLEANIITKEYRADYNQERPNLSLAYLTPLDFTPKCHHRNQGLTTVLAH